MEAGEVVYQGREGTGGAQIFNMPKSGLGDFVVRQAQLRAANKLKQQQMEQETARYENKELNDYYDNLKTPGTIDPILRPQIEAATGNIREETMRMRKQGLTSNEIRSAISPKYQNVLNMAAKADKIGTIAKDLHERAKSDPAVNQEWVRPEINKITHGGLIDDIEPEKAEDVLNSGYAIKRPVAIQLGLKNVRDQIETRINNGEVENDIGKFYEFKNNEFRFKKTNGKYDDGLINMVFDSDPRIVKNIALEFSENLLRESGVTPDRGKIESVAERVMNGDYTNDPVLMKKWEDAKYKGVADTVDQLQTQRQMTTYQSAGRYPTNSNSGDGAPQTTKVGDGDNNLTDYSSIPSSGKIGYDNLAFGYSGNEKAIPFSETKGGESDQTGMFSGLRTNPKTGVIEMEFITTSPGTTQKNVVYAPYDEKTYQQVRTALPPAKRKELDAKKNQFDQDFNGRKEYKLDDTKLSQDVDAITDYYKENEANVGTEEFNKGFTELINKLGLDKTAKSNKTFWWFNPNELTIGDQTIEVTNKEKLKQVLYDSQKGRYKKQAGAQAEPATPEDFDSQWSKLKSGETIVGPDGKTYKKP